MALSIYLAGPDVFLPNAIEVGRTKVELCRRFGFDGLFPLDQEEDAGGDAAEIFRANCGLMERAEIGIFNLTPFRGPSADAGTVFELGFMFSRNKPVFGYGSASAVYRERVEAIEGPLPEREGMRWDRAGYSVEDFGLTDNLMIERAIRDAGGTIVTAEEASGDPLAALQAFEACLAIVANAHGLKGQERGTVLPGVS